MATDSIYLRRWEYDDAEAEELISRSTWALKAAGLLFGALLVVGRTASAGAIVWSPTYHSAGAPLVVVANSAKTTNQPVPRTPKTVPGADPAALAKRAAAFEVVVFSPGKTGHDGAIGPDSGSQESAVAVSVAGDTEPGSAASTAPTGGAGTGQGSADSTNQTGGAGTAPGSADSTAATGGAGTAQGSADSSAATGGAGTKQGSANSTAQTGGAGTAQGSVDSTAVTGGAGTGIGSQQSAGQSTTK